MCTTTILSCIKAPKLFWKIYFLYDFWCAVLDYLYELWHLLSALYSDVRKKLYRCTCTFLALNYCCGIFFQIPQLSIRSGAHNLFPDFWTFRNFDRNFANIMAPSSDENENCIALLKGRSLPRKMLKTASKLIHKPRRNYREAMIVRTTHPVERTARRIGAWQKTNTTFSHLHPACLVRSSPNRTSRLLKGVNHFFDPTHSFFSTRVHGKFRAKWPMRGCTAITRNVWRESRQICLKYAE